jgi:GGDEF domain-containing protein
MSCIGEQAAFLMDVCRFIPFATEHGFTVTGGELYRTTAQQEIYLRTGKSKTRDSRHLYRCAIDLNFFKSINNKFVLIDGVKELRQIGDHWRSLNLKNDCGIRWGWDTGHFERRN